ncbi:MULTISPECIES: hypothetical protein [unclassified Streptomyces]|uniref:hypothetical protein n=1 Tax=Streptomyces sp. NPDC127129 TaxID=3345373 RepID=UPI00362A82EF
MDDTTLLRNAMDRITEDLPPLPDLAPLAMAQGRRRRSRARLAAVGGVFGTVTAATLGLTLLPGPGGAPASPAAPPDASPSAYRTPVQVQETPGVPPPDNPEGLPAAERERRAGYQQQVAAVLDELLPASVTDVRPVKDQAQAYRITSGGTAFDLTLSVRRSDDLAPRPCPSPADERARCETAALDGARDQKARLRSLMAEGPDTWTSWVDFSYGRSAVRFSVAAGEATAPVTPEQLLAVARDSRLLDLVRYADEHPVEKKDAPPVQGG